MYIFIFIVFLVLSLVLVLYGLYKPEHTELSLVGFLFMFVLSFLIINNSLTIITGTNTSSTFNYTLSASNLTLLTSSFERVENIYTPIELEGTLAHTIGYWLAVISVIGFIGILMSLRRQF